MGYYDKFLMHDDRNKGMNSTSNEKGTDGKKNNTSEYNHQYYLKNKEKWQDSNINAKGKYYTEGDKDFLDGDDPRLKSIGDSDFAYYQKPDGSIVVQEEDLKWVLPPGTSIEKLKAAIDNFDKQLDDLISKGKDYNWDKLADEAINSIYKTKTTTQEFDIDAAAKDVIRGKYGSGEARKKALGDDYAAVQNRVNEMLGSKARIPVQSKTEEKKEESKKSDVKKPLSRQKNITGTGKGVHKRSMEYSDFYSDYLAHHGILGQKWGVRRFEKAGGGLTAAGKKRYDTDENGNYKKIGKTSSKAGSSDGGQKKGLSDEQKAKLKKAAIIAGAATAAALATYGGYKLHQLNKKAKEGLSNEYHEAAKDKFLERRMEELTSDGHHSIAEKASGDLRAQFFKSSREAGDRADLAREAGEILQEKAKNKNYSLKEKADYLKNQNTAARENRINKALTYKKDGSFTSYALHKQGIKTVEPNRIKIDRVESNRINLNSSGQPHKAPSSRTISNSNERLQNTLNQMKSMNASNKSVSDANNQYVYDLIRKNSQTLSSLGF